MIIVMLEVINKEEKSCFLMKTFLLANFSMGIVFNILFFI